jgi:hypothetical protein
MNIFDLEQYFSLYKEFKNRMISISEYGITPYRDEFIDIKVIQSDENKVIFYYDPLKTLFQLSTNKPIWDLKKISLKKDYVLKNEDYAKFVVLMDAFENHKTTLLVQQLDDSTLISDKVRSSLTKLKRKMG